MVIHRGGHRFLLAGQICDEFEVFFFANAESIFCLLFHIFPYLRILSKNINLNVLWYTDETRMLNAKMN